MINEELLTKINRARQELYANPSSVVWWKRIADLLHQAKEFQAYIRYGHIIQQMDPSVEMEVSTLTHSMREQFSDKNEVISDPKHREILDKANRLITQGSYDHAIATVSVPEMEPYYSTLITKGLALHKLGQYERAITNYKAVLEKTKDRALIHYNWATSLIKLERFDEAKSHMELALKENDSDPVYWFQTGFVLKSLGDWKSAEQYFDYALLLEPKNANAAYLLAVAKAQTAPEESAVTLINWALRWVPSWKDFFMKDPLLEPLHKFESWKSISK